MEVHFQEAKLATFGTIQKVVRAAVDECAKVLFDRKLLGILGSIAPKSHNYIERFTIFEQRAPYLVQ